MDGAYSEIRQREVYASSERAREQSERRLLEAQCHAMEARSANSTIRQIYQAVTCGTGEPGNWNGAGPVIAELERLRGSLREIKLRGLSGAKPEDLSAIAHDALNFWRRP